MSTWRTVPFWSVARRIERSGAPDSQLLSVYREWGVVRRDDRDDNFNRASEDLSAYKIVKRGNLVLNKMKTWQGSLGVSPFDGIVSPAYFVCELRPSVDGRFVHHLLRSRWAVAQFAANSKGIRPNQWDLPYEVLRQLPLHMPSREEQRQIADFLDDRVARTDLIIAARRRQLELLGKHQESALELTMRPETAGSGRWLRVKHVASKIGSGKTPRGGADAYVDYGIAFLRSQNVHDEGLRFEDVAYIPPEIDAEMRETRVDSGDVLLNITGGSLGRCCVTTTEALPANVSQHVCIIRPRTLESDRLALLLRSRGVRDQIRLAQVGGNREGLNFEQVGDLAFWVPDDPGVWDAARRLEVGALDQRARLERSCQMLSEYKQSLITAAVTGEFDVATASMRVPGE